MLLKNGNEGLAFHSLHFYQQRINEHDHHRYTCNSKETALMSIFLCFIFQLIRAPILVLFIKYSTYKIVFLTLNDRHFVAMLRAICLY